MTEATWGDEAGNPSIDWRMSVALENVPRGEEELAEVTSLEGAVRTWSTLDRPHQEAAVITLDHPIIIDGTSHASFSGQAIVDLATRLREDKDEVQDGAA
jgi:hypothetical protein